MHFTADQNFSFSRIKDSRPIKSCHVVSLVIKLKIGMESGIMNGKDTLSSDWAKAQGDLIILKQLDISPEVFDIILKFIYGGTICLAEHDARIILELLISTDELELDDLTDYIQDYLLNNSWRLMSHFALFHRFAMQNDERFPIIRKCVIELVKENPTTIFDSNDFTTMDQDILISFFKCHNFSSIKPGILWRNLVEWGVAHTPTVPLKYAEWTDDDFKALGETLEPLIPLINFTDMDTEEFLSEVRPWKKSLDYVDPDFYTQTLEIRQLPFINVTSKFLSLLLENNKIIKEIDSNLITPSDATLISNWIHEVSINDNCECRCVKTSYEHKIRDSEDEFSIDEYEVFQIVPITTNPKRKKWSILSSS
ncbi:unnamed protein product [Rhizophagus irregularis]|nr:unnamed protein product [Rhizophagus irregularis]